MILKTAAKKDLANWLQQHRWLQPGEELLDISDPGKGNMNYVIRLHTTQRTFILKQSMPWVEKYPSIAAPQERLLTEFSFYNTISRSDTLSSLMPSLLHCDKTHYILAMEDVANMQDGSILYSQPGILNRRHINSLLDYLNELHSISIQDDEAAVFKNEKMRALNAMHIFEFPFMEENGFNLDTVQQGLQEAALPFKKDKLLKEKLKPLKEIYLAVGHSLQHGDFYPGSWLINETSIKVIDPEFCFAGNNVFDLSVLLAHLKMARSLPPIIQEARALYNHPVDEELLQAFTGAEILRRLIGLAQLPLSLTLTEKKELMDEARSLIC